MHYCAACCMQELEESSLCPSPAAADLQRYTNILHITNVSSSSACLCFSVNPFEMCVSHLQAQGESCVHINCMFILKFHSGSGMFVFSLSSEVTAELCHHCAAAIFLCLIGYFFTFCYVFPSYSIVSSPSVYLSSCWFRYFFPPLEPPRTGTMYGHLLPPSSLIEHCDAEPAPPPQQALPHRHSSRALLPLTEAEGQPPGAFQFRGTLDAKGHNESSWNVWKLINTSDCSAKINCTSLHDTCKSGNDGESVLLWRVAAKTFVFNSITHGGSY